MTPPHMIARAVTGDTAPLERAQEFLARFDAALRRGIPERALLVVLHNQAERGEAWSRVKGWLTGGGLYVLSGPLGTGKTVAAVYWAGCRSAAWVPASKAWEAERQPALLAAPAMVIDEIGGPGSVGDLQTQRIASLLIERHSCGRASLLTTNFDRAAIGRLFDGDAARSRVLDRLDEDGEFAVIRERMRRPGTAPSWTRVEDAHKLVRAWAVVEQIAAGQYDGDDARSRIDTLRALIGFDDDALAKALAQQEKLAEMLSGAAQRYASELRPVHDFLLDVEREEQGA